MLNDESRKYFKQSIALSGAVNKWNGYVIGDHRCLVEKFANRYNQSIDSNNFIDFLKNISESEINQFSIEVLSFDSANSVWWPMIEGQYGNK